MMTVLVEVEMAVVIRSSAGRGLRHSRVMAQFLLFASCQSNRAESIIVSATKAE